jgi:two-component system chemotaxis response regulator CheB
MLDKGEKGKKRRIRVVVGEDSSLMRRLIVEVLSSDPAIEVVGTGSNGREVLKRTVELKPDCITLDLEMPCMDGLEALRYIMSEWPTPVVILSAHTAVGARMTLTCLECGAVDFVTKTHKGSRFPAEELIAKVKLAATVDAAKVRFTPPDSSFTVKGTGRFSKKTEGVVLIGASTGGPQALMDIIPALPPDLPAGVIIVQHMPPNFTRYLAERLDDRSALAVREAEERDVIRAGEVLVAPGGMHLFIEERLGQPVLMLLARNKLQRSACPSIDFALTSFAPVFRERLIGVILTGMGRDGTAGSISVRRYGGSIICQDSETSMIFGMPGAVIEGGLANDIVPLRDVAGCIVKRMSEARSGEPVHEG